MHRGSNVLVVVDAGHGPRRDTDFDNAILAFRPTPAQVGPPPIPGVLVDNQPYNLGGITQPPTDLVALAQDRRWQSIDTIRTTKSALGTGLLAGGGVMAVKGLGEGRSRMQSDLIIAGSLAAAGLFLKATSQADVREWGVLPRATYILPLTLTPGTHTVTISLSDGSTQTWTNLQAPAQGESTLYLRLHRFSGYAYPAYR